MKIIEEEISEFLSRGYKMRKIEVKGCPSIADSIYADGRKESGECSLDTKDVKCKDKENCPIKLVVRNLMSVVGGNLCNSCDGCGYAEGCTDTTCGTYQAHKCLELLKVEEI